MPTDSIEFWIDINLPPILATWITNEFNVPAKSFYQLGLTTTSDADVFRLAKARSNAIVITTKDYDFVSLTEEIGAPPKILYLNTGNISNKELKKIILSAFKNVIRIFSKTNQTIIEITNIL